MTDGDPSWRELTDRHRRDLDLGDVHLHLVDLGRGPAVVAVHGWGDSSYCWHRNAAALVAAGLRVVLVDQPGLGRSSPPPPPDPFTLEGQARQVLVAVDALGIGRFRVAGHSMGGAIALELCRAQGERVERAAVIAPLSFRPRRPRMALPGVHRLASALPRRPLIRLTLRLLYGDRSRVERRVVDAYVDAAARPDYFLSVAGLARSFFSPGFDRLLTALPGITTPILIVWGDRDPWLPVDRGRELAATLPRAELMVVDGAGHLPHQERPGQVNPRLAGFLSGC